MHGSCSSGVWMGCRLWLLPKLVGSLMVAAAIVGCIMDGVAAILVCISNGSSWHLGRTWWLPQLSIGGWLIEAAWL